MYAMTASFIRARVYYPLPIVLRLFVLTSIWLPVAKLPALVHDCFLIKPPIRPHCLLYTVRRLRKVLNSYFFPILLDNVRDEHEIFILGELVQENEVRIIHRRVNDILLLIRILGARHRLQPLCAIFGRLVEPGRDEGGCDGGLGSAGVWRGLVDFGACGQVVVRIGCDPEVPA
jgi:hypothetical protein